MADPTLGYTLAQQGVNLAETPTSSFNYRYPLTKLDSSDDYLKITILEYKPPGFVPTSGFALPTAGELSGYETSTPKGTIILPIPDDVKDSNGVTWGNSSLGPIQALAAAAGESFIKNPGDVIKNAESSMGKILSASQTGTAQKTAQAVGISFGISKLLGGNESTNNFTSRYAGAVFNSNIELVFSSVNLREAFTFGFDIVPRSQKEAQQVKDIIRAFKKHSAAKKSIGAATGLFLKAPEVFKLEYMNGTRPHPYLNKFKICALQSMGVNYTPSGTYATYADAAPVNMTLTLSFKELTPIYSEDYDTGAGTEGTGY